MNTCGYQLGTDATPLNKCRNPGREGQAAATVKVTRLVWRLQGQQEIIGGGAGLPEVLVTVFPNKGQQGEPGLEGKLEKLPRFPDLTQEEKNKTPTLCRLELGAFPHKSYPRLQK